MTLRRAQRRRGFPRLDEDSENCTNMEEVSETSEGPRESAIEENPASKQDGTNLELKALSLSDGGRNEIPAI